MKPTSLVLFLWTFLSVGASVSDIGGWIDESWSENTTTYRYRRDVDRSPPNNKKTSLVFVFDDTSSMHDDLRPLQLGARSIVAEFEKRVNNPIYNYILVRFNDPRVGDAFITMESKELLKALDEIEVHNGGDCPELAFQGIINGINAALPQSPVFVFTDATPKDKSLLDDAINLARWKQISVSFLLSGRGCDSNLGDFLYFNTLAEKTSGQVYTSSFAKSNVEDVVRSIADVMDTGLVSLISTNKKAGKNHDIIYVDGSITKIIISVAGEKPVIGYMSPHNEKIINVTTILNIPSARTDIVVNPPSGIWNITISSDSPPSIKISGVSDILVRYGFSYIRPKEYPDTSPIPIKDISNYLSVFVWKNNRNHRFTHAELVIVTPRAEISHANHTLKTLDPANCDSDLCIYATVAFIPPLDTFKIFVRGMDAAGNPVKYLVSTNIESVSGVNLRPKVKISKSEVKVKEGDDVHLVCKVSSPTRSDMKWYFRNNVVFGGVEYKGTEVYLNFYGITLDDSGIYLCLAKNTYGQQYEKVKIFVEAISWNIEMHETDMKATENESNYVIKCKITPKERKVAVKWIFNGASVIQSDDFQILGDTLLLKTVNRRHQGNFTCRGTFNGVSKSSSGHFVVEYPPIILGPAYEKRLVKFDDKVVLKCTANGNPKPNIRWIREDGSPSNGVIKKFSPADYGLHICEASNGVGSVARKNVTIETKYGLKPKVILQTNRLTVNEDDRAQLSCEVTSPKPVDVQWIFNNGDKINESPHRQIISDKDNTTLVLPKALLEDVGTYSCVAINSFGKDKESVNLTVVPIPLDIHIVQPRMQVTENDKNVTMECIVQPTKRRLNLKWMFNERILNHSNEFQILGDTLILQTVNRRHEGNYTCGRTFNGVSKSSSGHLAVHYQPSILGPAYEKRLVQFEEKIVLECAAEGNPKPNISWIREDGSPSNGVIEKFSPADYGIHICEASNGVGSVARKIVTIETKYGLKPKVIVKINKLTANEDDRAQLSCEVTSPKPVDVKWIFNDGDKITESPHRQITRDKDNTILVLHKAQLEDVGRYSCVATNSFGKDKESVNLKVVPIPLDIKIAQPRMQVTENDKNVTIECIVQPKKRRLNLKWMFNEKLFHNSDEFQTSGNKLIIKTVHRSHTGHFTCLGEFHEETKTAKGYLNVLYSPEIIGATKERHTIKFDDRVSLKCSAVGNPEPKISWFRDDKSNASPIIEKFSPDHYGNHSCKASNGVGVPAFKLVFLNSTASELPKLITSDYYNEVRTEQNLTLQCRCKQCGPIRYSEWVRLDDGELISGVTGPSEDGSQDYNFDLHLVNVTLSHTNGYMCIIGNEFGIAKEAMRVNVTDQPTIKGIVARGADSSTAVVIKVQPGKQVILTCLVVGSPKPAVRWYKNEKVLPHYPSFMDNILRFEKVSENDIGKYTCEATNSLGTMSKDIKLLVAQSNFAMNTILVTDEGQTISLPCESRTWLLNDELLDVSKARYTLIENILVFNAKYEDSGVYQCLSLDGTAESPGETVLMVQTAPVIIPSEDDNIRVRKSREAILKCKSHGYPLPEISWIFNGTNLFNSPAYEILQGGGLKIKGASELNTGLYTCRASNKIGHAERAVNVIVTVPSNITSEFNSTWRISPGDSSSLLTCSASGKPVPGVSWLRDGNVHVGERPAENFLNIGPDMLSGNYTCIAKNLDGVDTRSIIVTSRGPPIISDRHHQTRYHLFEGSELNLLCPFTNAKDTLWFKDGVKLDGIRSGPQELLTIPLAEREHAGSYTCTASNNYGERSFMHHVHIFPSDHAYPNADSYKETLTEVVGNDLVLNCPHVGDIPPNTKWIVNNRVVSTGPRLDLMNLQLNDTGKYICKDEEGEINLWYYLTVESGPEVQMAKEKWISVEEGENLELECLISGIPAPTISWIKDSSQPIASATSTILNIRGVSSDQVGTYKCSGSNHLGVVEIIHHVDVLRAPEIIVGNREIMVRRNNEATFLCEATGNPLPTLVWSFQGSKLLGTESIRISNELEYTNLNLNPDGVIVRKSNITDELQANVKYNKDHIFLLVKLQGERKIPGRYTCSAINTLGSKEVEIELKILEPLTKLKDAQPCKVSVLAGLPLFLSCPWSEDRAMTTIQWVKNGVPLDTGLSDDRGTLSIPATSLSNAGIYACLAKNFGSESKKEFDVRIRGTPYYDIDAATKNVILKCPEPEIPSGIVIWDELLIGDDNITNNEVETSTDLTINDAHPLTIYTCYHEDFNSGVRTKKLELQVLLTAAVGYLETSRTAYIGDQVRMYCPLVPEHTKSIIDWLKEDRRIMNTRDKLFSRDRKMIVIREVKLEDEGTYKCRAVSGDTERGIVLRTKHNTPEWSDWESWTPCTKSCGTGIHTRQRQCISPNGETWHTAGSYCLGNSTEKEPCNNFPCPVNGNWTEWSDWKPCPDKCWDTINEPEPRAQRSRECTSPAPFMGGRVCLGLTTEERLCRYTPCPIHGGW